MPATGLGHVLLPLRPLALRHSLCSLTFIFVSPAAGLRTGCLVPGLLAPLRGGSPSPGVLFPRILRPNAFQTHTYHGVGFWADGVLKKQASSGGRMAHVFVYGTLKTGQPNHRVLLDGAHGRATLRGRARTLEPYPLVIAGEHNIPWLLQLPGHGRCVAGEVYAVDEQMLRFLDEFEGCPDMYQRTRLTVAVEGPAGGTVQCFAYSTATYPPEWLQLPHLDDYDSQGEHGLRYNPRENR
uniref:Gamma-glutamylaminecyclotransferase n=1 Tax=Sus scrofa TaxID=9823 RepID=A0A8D1KCP5_PIG